LFFYKTLTDWVSNESVRFPAFNFAVCVTNFVVGATEDCIRGLQNVVGVLKKDRDRLLLLIGYALRNLLACIARVLIPLSPFFS